jgi:hypothetical protein
MCGEAVIIGERIDADIAQSRFVNTSPSVEAQLICALIGRALKSEANLELPELSLCLRCLDCGEVNWHAVSTGARVENPLFRRFWCSVNKARMGSQPRSLDGLSVPAMFQRNLYASRLAGRMRRFELPGAIITESK